MTLSAAFGMGRERPAYMAVGWIVECEDGTVGRIVREGEHLILAWDGNVDTIDEDEIVEIRAAL